MEASALGSQAEGLLSKASCSAHAAVDAIAGVADEAARKARPAIDRAALKAHKAVDTAVDAAGPAADWLAQKSEPLDATQKKLISGTCSYVTANPLKAVGIAAAAGMLLGRIVR